MSVNERVINATPRDVDAVLRDGWNYADWVVGAVHIRSVDKAWPAPGSRVYHRVGAWPVMVSDNTEVVAYEPAEALQLRARLWPFGEATIRLDWAASGHDKCRVRMDEQFVQGPALALRNKVADLVLHARNSESLIRLEHLTQKYRS
jgi:hypothetical protein